MVPWNRFGHGSVIFWFWRNLGFWRIFCNVEQCKNDGARSGGVFESE